MSALLLNGLISYKTSLIFEKFGFIEMSKFTQTYGIFEKILIFFSSYVTFYSIISEMIGV